MSTQDQRFMDIAPKVYYTICNPVKVCCEYAAAKALSLAPLSRAKSRKGLSLSLTPQRERNVQATEPRAPKD